MSTSKETHKVDICSSMNFANHDAWWKCYKQKLKEEGKMMVSHHQPLPAAFLDKFQNLIVLLFRIEESRNESYDVYKALLLELPESERHCWHRLLHHCLGLGHKDGH